MGGLDKSRFLVVLPRGAGALSLVRGDGVVGGPAFCTCARPRRAAVAFGAVGRRSCCRSGWGGVRTARCGVRRRTRGLALDCNNSGQVRAAAARVRRFERRKRTQNVKEMARVIVALILTAGAALQPPALHVPFSLPPRGPGCTQRQFGTVCVRPEYVFKWVSRRTGPTTRA